MRIILMALMILAAPTIAAAQETQAEEAVCVAAGGCRVVEQLRIEGPNGEEEVIELGITMPWLTRGNVMLTPGESVTIALEEIEGILVPTLISVGDASRTAALTDGQVRFDFGGFERGRLMLSVLSQYPQAIEYGALKVTLGLGPERTSVCTLMPGVAVFETWQEPIYQMALFGFREAEGNGCTIIDDDAAFTAEGT